MSDCHCVLPYPDGGGIPFGGSSPGSVLLLGSYFFCNHSAVAVGIGSRLARGKFAFFSGLGSASGTSDGKGFLDAEFCFHAKNCALTLMYKNGQY